MTVHAIDLWWAFFAKRAEDIDAHFKRLREFGIQELMAKLDEVDPRLMWEFGPAVSGKGHRLCITPETHFELRPMLRVLMDRAPNIPGWEFYPYRLADSVGDDPKISDSRTAISTDGAMASVSRGRGNRIDLTYFLSPPATEKDARTFAFITSERLVGEELLDQWIGAIEVGDPSTEGGPKRVPLSRIKPTIDSVIDSIHSQLPAVPRYQLPLQPDVPKPHFTLFEMEVALREGDYPGWSDQFTGVTPEPELFKAARGGNFYSVRFSRCGETFCYLKIDGVNGLDPAHFADRGELEDAITASLTQQQLGCSCGGGAGQKYSYVELALVDVERSIPVLRDLLRRGNIHRRSRLLFHDCTLANEWVGIFDDTQAPP